MSPIEFNRPARQWHAWKNVQKLGRFHSGKIGVDFTGADVVDDSVGKEVCQLFLLFVLEGNPRHISYRMVSVGIRTFGPICAQ